MRVVVKAVNLAIDARTRGEVAHRIEGALARCAGSVLRVAVRVADRNGPRGGVDIACSVEVRLRRSGTVYVEETDVDLAGAVGRAGETAARSVIRVLERARDLRRRGAVRAAYGTSEA